MADALDYFQRLLQPLLVAFLSVAAVESLARVSREEGQ